MWQDTNNDACPPGVATSAEGPWGGGVGGLQRHFLSRHIFRFLFFGRHVFNPVPPAKPASLQQTSPTCPNSLIAVAQASGDLRRDYDVMILFLRQAAIPTETITHAVGPTKRGDLIFLLMPRRRTKRHVSGASSSADSELSGSGRWKYRRGTRMQNFPVVVVVTIYYHSWEGAGVVG